MTKALTLLAGLLALAALPAGAEGAAPPAEGEEGEAEPPLPYVPVALMVGAVAYTAEVQIVDAPPADLRLFRTDGVTMADQSYLVPELGAQACAETGFDFDAALPAKLAEDGSWMIAGGCR